MKIWKPTMTQYFKKMPRTGFKAPTEHDPARQDHSRFPASRAEHRGGGEEAAEGRLRASSAQFVYSNSTAEYGFIGWSPSSGARISEFGTVDRPVLQGT